MEKKKNGKSLGLLFEEDNTEIERVFLKAIQDANVKVLSHTYPFTGITERIPYGNAYTTSKKLCKLLRSGVAAIFGPTSMSPAKHAISLCDAKEMPYIDVRWDPEPHLPTINLHPYPPEIIHVLTDLIKAFGWKGFTALYESGPYLPILKEMLQLYGPKGYTVTVRKYDLDLDGNYRHVLRRVKKSEDKRIVIVGSIKTLPELLKQAQQVGIMTDHYEYIIANLDLYTLDLEPFQHCDANITGIRLVNTRHEKMVEVLDILNDYENVVAEETFALSLDAALIYDGVFLLAQALSYMNRSDLFHPVSLNCSDSSTWDKGYSLVNFIKTTSVDGLTGEIKFNNKGLRTDFLLDIIELAPSGLSKVGTWNSTSKKRLQFQRNTTESLVFDDRTLRNKSFVVLTALTDPYGMLKDSADMLTGNDRFEGYGIDLIQELSMELGFNYTFHMQEDGNYGSYNAETNSWNGMLREIMEDRADLAIADLTMTSERETAVDFTMPFMSLGISILYKKPTTQDPKLFSFMSPFSNEVWLFLGASYIGVSVSLFILGRLSPKEWDNPYPCIEEPTVLENQFSFRNSLWFTIGALLQQGSEVAPKAPSTRTVASIWWFFTLIMVSSYTANLAAFLTIVSVWSPISSAEDLANANGAIKYGAKRDGSTLNFFKDAKEPIYKKMYEYMKAHEDLLTSSNDAGLEKVKNENYAFMMESTSIQYMTQRNCEVAQIGSQLDEKGYGIAMKKNSPYRNALSQAILSLQERGVLDKLKNKWWNEKRGGGACPNEKDDTAKALSTANLGGVFFVLLVGSIGASCFGICEWLYVISKRARYFKTPLKEEFMDELKFVFKCSGNTKVVRHQKSSSLESSHSSMTLGSSNTDDSEK